MSGIFELIRSLIKWNLRMSVIGLKIIGRMFFNIIFDKDIPLFGPTKFNSTNQYQNNQTSDSVERVRESQDLWELKELEDDYRVLGEEMRKLEYKGNIHGLTREENERYQHLDNLLKLNIEKRKKLR